MGGAGSKGQQIKGDYDAFALAPDKAALATWTFRGKKQRRASFVQSTLERVLPTELPERAKWREARVARLTQDMEVRITERNQSKAEQAREVRAWRQRANTKQKKRRAQILADAGMSPDGEAMHGPPVETADAVGAVAAEAARWWNVLDEWAVVRCAVAR